MSERERVRERKGGKGIKGVIKENSREECV